MNRLSTTDLRIRNLRDRLELMDALGKKRSPLYRKIARDLEILCDPESKYSDGDEDENDG